MTFEQKVEKLREIVDKKIAIHTETEQEDIEFCNMINNCFKYSFEIEDCNEGYLYTFTFEDEFQSEISIDVGVLEYSHKDYQIVPYSEFFADDKVDKPLEDWTLKEIIEHYNNRCEDYKCEDCPIQKMCDVSEIEDWNFISVIPQLILTQSEIDILKAIKLLYGGDVKILYAKENNCFVDDDDTYQIPTFSIESDRLPSLSRDKEYNIDELLEGVN
jgi:hypothetical protein